VNDPRWAEVDRLLASKLAPSDEALDRALAASAAAALPAIQVSAVQGKLLAILARSVGARRILEVGTLGGYSTIWLARALGPDGRIVTLEISEKHADVARQNLAAAGLADRVDVRVGPALESLAKLEGPFDFAFIDADKKNNARYFARAVDLARPGALVVVDNVVRGGAVLDAATADENVVGTRALYDAVAADRRVIASAMQTVGEKGWDGMLVATVL